MFVPEETAIAEPVRPLHLVRRPGKLGPIIRCLGPLTVFTVEGLRRELDLLIPLGHPVLILNLTNCRPLDRDGLLLLRETHQRMFRLGRTLVLVAASEPVSRQLELLGADASIPLFLNEDAAALVLRSDGPAVPATAIGP